MLTAVVATARRPAVMPAVARLWRSGDSVRFKTQPPSDALWSAAVPWVGSPCLYRPSAGRSLGRVRQAERRSTRGASARVWIRKENDSEEDPSCHHRAGGGDRPGGHRQPGERGGEALRQDRRLFPGLLRLFRRREQRQRRWRRLPLARLLP